MSEIKIVIQDKIFTSNDTTNLVLPLFLDYDGIYFPGNQWTDFADILNMWANTLLQQIGENESKFILYFMDGPYRLDVTKDREMKLTIRCVNFRDVELIELAIQCEYVDLLKAVYKAVNKFSRILYDQEMHQDKYKVVYKQSLITSKELKAAIDRLQHKPGNSSK